MTYRFHYAARSELNDAVDWYENRRPGLGSDLLEEIYATIRRIVANPRAYARAPRVAASREVHFLPVRRYEYVVVYEILPAEIVILAVAHGRRRYQRWRRRR